MLIIMGQTTTLRWKAGIPKMFAALQKMPGFKMVWDKEPSRIKFFKGWTNGISVSQKRIDYYRFNAMSSHSGLIGHAGMEGQRRKLESSSICYVS
jgi:hypothetical protein